MYQEITKDEYQDHYGYNDDGHKLGSIEKFSESELNKIKQLLKGYEVKLRVYPDGKSECINIYTEKGLIDFNRSFYNIDKIDDDWYLVADTFRNSNFKFYKCDQFDGLLKFLSDTLIDKMKHIKTFEAIAPRIKVRPTKETLEKIQTELEDFLLDELDTYEIADQDDDGNGGKSLKELPSFVSSRPRYVFSIKFKTPFTKSAESLSNRLSTWNNDYNFTLKSIECQSTSYWSEDSWTYNLGEQSFTNIKITFDL